MTIRRLTLPLAAILLVAGLAGCAAKAENGTASAYIKDAVTTNFSQIHVVVTQVAIHQSSDGNTTAGWTVLFSGSADIDLMNASGTRAAFLGQNDLPAGKYQQMRLQVESAYGIDLSGARVEIALPAKDLKVVKGFKIEAGKETQLVLDIDLEKSLKESKDGWEFKPVIGKLYAAIKEKSAKPAAGKIDNVELKDDAAQ